MASMLLLSTLFFFSKTSRSQVSSSLFLYKTSQKIRSIHFYNDKSQRSLERNINSLIDLNKVANELLEFNLSTSQNVDAIISRKEVLTGSQLDTLSKIIDSYHILGIKLLQVISLYTPNKELPLSSFFAKQDEKNLKENLLWFSAHLILYENFSKSHKAYWRNGKIRRMIKNIIFSKKKVTGIRELGRKVLSRGHKKELKSYANLLKKEKKFLLQEDSPLTNQLINQITENSSFKVIQKTKWTMPSSDYQAYDKVVGWFGTVTNFISKKFGNFAGKIRWRDGYFFNNKKALALMTSNLRPLDIVVEKTPFIFTDQLIPGHFGHVALWLGTEEQLKDYGLWDLPAIRPFHKDIRNGRSIIEATRYGVRLSRLKDFMQIDEVAIIRDRGALDDTGKTNLIFERAFEHLGKEYDFNFDLSTVDKIVCSELIFLAFGHINWPTEYLWGRNTISPDNVSELIFYEQSPIELNYYMYSLQKNDISELNIEDFAKNLQYRKNKELSTQDSPYFEKKVNGCFYIRKKSPYTNEIQIVRVCKTKYKRYVYQSKERNFLWNKWYGHTTSSK